MEGDSKSSCWGRHVYILLGIVMVSVYLLGGVAFSVVIQLIGTQQQSTWDKPYLEAYFYHAVWALLTPVAVGIFFLERLRKPQLPRRLPWRPLVLWGLFSGPCICFSSFFYYMALSRLPLAISSALLQGYFLLVFALSVPLLHERVTLAKLLSSLLCLAGLGLTAWSGLQSDDPNNNLLNVTSNVTFFLTSSSSSSSSSPSSSINFFPSSFFSSSHGQLVCCPVWGYLFLAANIILASIYQVVWAYLMNPVRDTFQRSFFLGFFGISATGLSCLLICWIGIVVGNFTQWEVFSLPSSAAAWRLVGLGTALDFLLNIANLLCIVLVSPVFVTVAALLVIPLNVMAQWLLTLFNPTSSPSPALLNAPGWAGMTLIVVGCALFQLADTCLEWWKQRKQNKTKGYQEIEPINE